MPRVSRLLFVLVIVAFVALALVSVRGLRRPPTPLHNAFGRGSTVVLVHGLGSRSEHWLPAARLLARKHRVVLIELPGHGASDMPVPFSLEQATEALDEAIAAESKDPVVLVGHSVGGLIAAAEALAHPKRVRALVLVETALKPQIVGAERDAMLNALDHDYQSLLRSVYGSFGRDSAQGAALYEEVAALEPASVKRWIRLALAADLSTQIRKLAPPLLAVLSDRSWPRNESWRETGGVLGYGLAPQVYPARIDDCGHFVMLDQPVVLVELIERFIAHPEGESIAKASESAR